MQISKTDIRECCHEQEIWNRLLSLDGAVILELGCGTAELTRQIAMGGTGRRITAMEVDDIQHAKNLQAQKLQPTDWANVHFLAGGAEAIPAPGANFDIVLMFKALHHVPLASMNTALDEIRRVLKPRGRSYISEPVFAGDFNEILCLFHNEEQVRRAAFAAEKKAVDDGRFNLVDEVFFLAPMYFADFAEFEQKVIVVTHSYHQLSDDVYRLVKKAFSNRMTDDGAHFLQPMRVDILERSL